ncbi:hypothetical protein G7047_19245 [Diaphorobacter sp. HDW4A]|uniref:hypothetical protein n=1 Tax=Diaphorobacter sp. HDW4A TaxID=2714924 RepID=UPI00140A2F28|nr:hypothetical protein [Diaphorobacter sp. HDW4A]QIL81814.1 hypothetical protein G7047_19245 [Diaphorobacter sp. HDW4A]
MISYNAHMPRLIAFIFCIAFLVGAGFSVRAGLAVAVVGLLALAGFVAWNFVAMFIGPKQHRP